jgi:uncharacterized protein (TIGR03000 family)
MFGLLWNPTLIVASVVGTAGMACASEGECGVYWPFVKCHPGPYATTAAFPTVKPPGWYTNTYLYPWHYPWYAYYNYSQGPYAEWLRGGGRAYYANEKPLPPLPTPANVTIFLPEEATLLFSGVVAEGGGAVRTFTTPVLALGVDYGYAMTIEFPRDGKIVKLNKLVTVHAGENVEVRFDIPEAKAVGLPVPTPKITPPLLKK